MTTGKSEPSIDAIAANPALAADLSPAQRQAIVHRCAGLISLVSGLGGKGGPMEAAQIEGEGRLLTVPELAALMGVKVSWVHHHSDDLPFAIRLPGQKRVNRYSYSGYLRWIRAREQVVRAGGIR